LAGSGHGPHGPCYPSCKSPKFWGLEGAEEDANSQDNSTGHPPHEYDQRLVAQIFGCLDVATPKNMVGNEEKKS